jgi:NADP-dependent 3-hydroxy acid dehydrogenase YdfG
MSVKTWFITGASVGFGRILTEKLLAQGHNVVATARKPEVLEDLHAQYPGQVIIPRLDVTDQESIDQAVGQARNTFGHIDVLVNNAGYGLIGTVEEVSDAEVRRQFDVNVFGLLNVSRPILAMMRDRRAGHVINLSSIAGLTSSATFALYCSSKHAVEAISEGLAASVAPFNIKVTLIEPGLFRTRFADSSSLQFAEKRIDDYNEQLQGTLDWLEEVNGKQPGDPAKVADAMIALVEQINPPLRLLCGADAYERATAKFKNTLEEFEQNAEFSKSMVYND